ncbi:hypothetical protein [Bradyrhizobium sp. SZCCHNS3053]|uniref:hypothetical protein n=1 Tax=Bradyrhizobium sp. SZCCHNS3053 TaxID=3057322 RepID=UPI0029170296|nr:hypothetical protein [Bradyrhizobium sp. SZCCHNS3053]
MRLGDWPLPYVRVKCAQCNREGRLKKDSLIERFGPDREMWVIRSKLTEPNCNRENKKLPCQSTLPDALLVQAIMEPDENKVVDPKLIPEAREWKEKLK